LWWKLVSLATSTCPPIINFQKFPKNKKHTQKSFNHLSLDYNFLCIYKNWTYIDFILLLFSRTICHQNRPTHPYRKLLFRQNLWSHQPKWKRPWNMRAMQLDQNFRRLFISKYLLADYKTYKILVKNQALKSADLEVICYILPQLPG